mmetsp:Transcript_62264/g.103353  ORF Transcript_62264/g.103353 Transcript_62264/m.103353 type:complete len:129 (-) Transcript_62264:1995-2381(-)
MPCFCSGAARIEAIGARGGGKTPIHLIACTAGSGFAVSHRRIQIPQGCTGGALTDINPLHGIHFFQNRDLAFAACPRVVVGIRSMPKKAGLVQWGAPGNLKTHCTWKPVHVPCSVCACRPPKWSHHGA